MGAGVAVVAPQPDAGHPQLLERVPQQEQLARRGHLGPPVRARVDRVADVDPNARHVLVERGAAHELAVPLHGEGLHPRHRQEGAQVLGHGVVGLGQGCAHARPGGRVDDCAQRRGGAGPPCPRAPGLPRAGRRWFDGPMSLRLSHTTWDALDPYAVAEFWRAVLGWEIQEPECYKPGSDE